jgi:pyridoxal phosphate enzyme (YggS family)
MESMAIVPERAAELRFAYETVKKELQRLAQQTGFPEARLVAVSKYKTAEDIKALYDAGQRHFGENYVQELVTKTETLPKDIQWHFIGSLQSNKCKVLAAISNLYVVETLDSESKAQKLNNARSESDAKLNVFIQVNTSGEEQKSGLGSYEEIVKLSGFIKQECPKLQLQGLMTIGSVVNSTNDSEVNQDFRVS